jgi:hypothetical protein
VRTATTPVRLKLSKNVMVVRVLAVNCHREAPKQYRTWSGNMKTYILRVSSTKIQVDRKTRVLYFRKLSHTLGQMWKPGQNMNVNG